MGGDSQGDSTGDHTDSCLQNCGCRVLFEPHHCGVNSTPLLQWLDGHFVTQKVFKPHHTWLLLLIKNIHRVYWVWIIQCCSWVISVSYQYARVWKWDHQLYWRQKYYLCHQTVGWNWVPYLKTLHNFNPSVPPGVQHRWPIPNSWRS